MPEYQLTDLNGETWLTRGNVVTPTYVKGIEGAEFGLDEIHGVGQRGVTVTGIDLKAGQIAVGCRIWPQPHGISDQGAVDILSAWRDGLGQGEVKRGDQYMEFRLLDTDRFQYVRLAKQSPVGWDRVRYTFITDEIVLQSDESDWRTEPLEYTFTAAEFATATVANDGTVPSWVHMRLTGPITNPKLGIIGEQVALPNLTAGQWLDIETDPNWYQVTDQAGVDRTFELTTRAAAAGADDRWRNQAPERTDSIKVNISGTNTTAATKLDITVPQIFRSAL